MSVKSPLRKAIPEPVCLSLTDKSAEGALAVWEKGIDAVLAHVAFDDAFENLGDERRWRELDAAPGVDSADRREAITCALWFGDGVGLAARNESGKHPDDEGSL